ncbi:MAG TPA: DUF971 domain-containing protein [Thermoanaerobaculia bacterium]|nr:DUF971 domain-containing protein [Thermoanaerobaculia bacterium]
MSLPLPTEIRRDPEARVLRLRWQDGGTSEIDYDRLRGYCPCAACQGHMVSEIRYHPPPRPVTPLEIAPVGRYAVSIRWSDGHTTGIYRFDFLRSLAEPAPGPPTSDGA